jgi:hypothetical protein
MNKSARANSEKICVLMKAVFRRHTLCMARKSDKIRAQIFRKAPQAICSSFTQQGRIIIFPSRAICPGLFMQAPGNRAYFAAITLSGKEWRI